MRGRGPDRPPPGGPGLPLPQRRPDRGAERWRGARRGPNRGRGRQVTGPGERTSPWKAGGRAASQEQLIPLIGFISVGLGSAVLYLLRLALYSPDISFWQFPPTTRASRKTVPVSELTPGCARAGESMPTPPAAPPQPPPALLAPACPMALRQSPCTQV
ncbi:NADH dehydrogenase [ubiquinone] 1 alpha subcomplex subunit 4-like 2 isoform X4 [Aquila chrysaetos chrysaetos]|uniref:NADH dehydrogenase [ubiquinone] 1 alpha subcomplex subunit 4-like 2 isoform X4 n=1 Tax=Aquila chrysaetos chrysaetos TaxID=223781 RepID=UPI00117686F2|nr:NADH dehydrogenase [ubiquinone] 1 alpha subcomplex subunit 4-like 2 isoform X4 [Aquila chrysaetos chrysaetos]